jgi:Lrp/AsnC family leucine-responsive transcriptional regulator
MSLKLDRTDKRILYELDQDARISETSLARLTSKSREAVHYRIKKMERAGIIIRYLAYIDVTRLGYRMYKIYLKLGGTPLEKQRFYDYVKGMGNVFWFGVSDGAWDAGITFFAKSDEEFNRMKNSMLLQFKGIIHARTSCVLINVYSYPRKFLVGGHSKPTVLFDRAEMNRIDDIDRRIIGILLKDARMRSVDIAKNAGTSVDVVRSRMKRLERSGVIARYTIAVDYEKIGREFFKAFLYFDGLDRKDELQLFSFAERNQDVVFLVRHIFPWDIEIEAFVENYKAYSRLIDQVRKLFPHTLRNVETAIFSQDHYFPSGSFSFE